MRVIRSFLALKLNLATVENLSAVQAQLKAGCRDAGIDIRWVPPPNIHITIRFLGQITEPMSHAVKDMLDPIVTRMTAFELECSGLRAFPNLRKPCVIIAGLGEESAQLNELYDTVYNRLLKAGFSFEDKPFVPHITIGRVKHAPDEALTPLLEEQRDTFFGTSLIRHFYCYQSDLAPHGAEYTAQWVLPLKRPAARSFKQPEADAPADASPVESAETNGDSTTPPTPQTGE